MAAWIYWLVVFYALLGLIVATFNAARLSLVTDEGATWRRFALDVAIWPYRAWQWAR
jgi:hypothetical protein